MHCDYWSSKCRQRCSPQDLALFSLEILELSIFAFIDFYEHNHKMHQANLLQGLSICLMLQSDSITIHDAIHPSKVRTTIPQHNGRVELDSYQ